MGLIVIIKPLSTVLSSAVNISRHHQEKILRNAERIEPGCQERMLSIMLFGPCPTLRIIRLKFQAVRKLCIEYPGRAFSQALSLQGRPQRRDCDGDDHADGRHLHPRLSVLFRQNGQKAATTGPQRAREHRQDRVPVGPRLHRSDLSRQVYNFSRPKRSELKSLSLKTFKVIFAEV